MGQLERLRSTLEIDHTEWADLTQVSHREYRRVLLEPDRLPITALSSLATGLNFSLEGFMEGDLDLRALKANRSGVKNYIPEKYRIAGFSKRRTVLTLLKYVETFVGQDEKGQILRRFQVDDSAFYEAPDEPINIRFLVDLFSYLGKSGVPDTLFYSVGTFSVVTGQKSALGTGYSECRTVGEIYEKMFGELLDQYEKNCDYRLVFLDEGRCVVEARSKSDVASALSVRHLGSAEVCRYKAGVFASGPGYLGLPFSQVSETQCVHRGDPCCRYEIDFSAPNSLVP